MIVEWLLSVGTVLVEWVSGLWGGWQLPSVMTNPAGMLQDIFDLGQGLEPWVDWQFCGIVAAIPLVVYGIGLAVRGGRAFASHIPLFGGNG